MTPLQICEWLYATSIGTAIRESTLLFPAIETAHVLGIALLAGTVAVVDLRLLGVVLRREPVSEIAGQILPWTWIGFAVMFVSGFLLFWAQPVRMYANPAFRLKLVLMILAGLNPLIFHSTVYRSVSDWDQTLITPSRARLTAVVSLSLWAGIIIAGRAIAYF